MTRNQLTQDVEKYSGGVIFTVDSKGNITPVTQQTVARGESILTHASTTSTTQFSGGVCARQNEVCQCSILISGVASGTHMAVGTAYAISATAPLGGDYELYAVTSTGPVANATNGEIHVGG
jgi:hypothetical protein